MKRFLLILAICLFLIFGLFFYLYFLKNDYFKIYFFDIGQGDSALIRFENGEKMLVDCGPDNKVLAKLGKALHFYDRTIDYLLVTHPDSDHYAGCIDVLKRYKVKKVITNGRNDSFNPLWEEFEKEKNKTKIKFILKSEEMIIGSNILNFFSPDENLNLTNLSDNNYSLVFRLQNNFTSVLFTGDMEKELEKALLDKYCVDEKCPLESSILKIGHHGSNNSTSEDFLAKIKPIYSIISVGKNNKFGHPALRIIRRLEKIKIKNWRTDEDGDVCIFDHQGGINWSDCL